MTPMLLPPSDRNPGRQRKRAAMEGAAFAASNGQTTAEVQANYFWQTTSYLVPDSDDAGYTVPLSRAPESYGYMTHVLTPNGTSNSVTVTVAGLPSTDSGADWRYVLEDVSGYGTANATVNTYSPVYANGTTQTITLTKDGYATDTERISVKANGISHHVTLKRGGRRR